MHDPMGYGNESRHNVYESAVVWIENLILSGKYKVGEKLPSEREMCESTGVSRTIMREALRAAESWGLVSIHPGKGIYIRNPDIKSVTTPLIRLIGASKVDFSNLHQARYIVEPNTAYLAALKCTDEHIEAMNADLEAMRREKGRSDLFLLSDQNFHFNIARMTGNPMLLILVKTMMDCMSITRAYLERLSHVERVIEHHTNIFEAVKRKDAPAAYKAMEDHLRHAEKNHELESTT
jgi:GntR family transcriptional repressor for pyruvate dehydrogenase complex